MNRPKDNDRVKPLTVVPDLEEESCPVDSPLQDSPLQKTVDTSRVDVYVQQWLFRPATEEVVVDSAQVTEAKIFSKAEVLREIFSFSVANGVELKDAEISRTITYNGRILLLEFKIPGADGEYEIITFNVAGKYNGIQSNTVLDRTSYKNDIPYAGGTIANYVGGRWVPA